MKKIRTKKILSKKKLRKSLMKIWLHGLIEAT